MSNTVTITRQWLAPFGCRCNTSSWAYATSFAATGSGASWTVGADLGPTAYANNGSGAVRVTMADTSTLATGNRVYITGTTAAVYDGFWTVTVIDATHIDLVSSTYSVNPAAKGTLKEVSRYHFRVVGWRTADELDTRNSFGVLFSLSPIGGNGIDISDIYNLSPTLATNELYLSWTLPRGVKFHHISIYMQTNDTSSWSTTDVAVKVLPTSANMTALYGAALLGNIPGHATRTIISSPTAHTYTMQQPVLETDTANDRIYIGGARAHIFYNGANLVFYGGADAGPQIASSFGTYVLDDDDGERTRIPITANLTASTTTVQFNAGPWMSAPAATLSTIATLAVVEDIQLNPKPLAEFDWQGNGVSIDTLNDCPVDGMLLSVPVTGFSGPDDVYRINWCIQNKYPVNIVTVNDTGSIVYAKTWAGRIIAFNKTGGVRKHANSTPSITLLIDRQYNYFRDLGYYGIASATSGTRTLTFNGDLTNIIPAGTAFRIQNSTGNDGTYAVESASYSFSTDITTVVTANTLPDGTDDGYIQVFAW